MTYKFINIEKEDAFDDVIEAALNQEEANGFKVVYVKWYESDHLKILLHKD